MTPLRRNKKSSQWSAGAASFSQLTTAHHTVSLDRNTTMLRRTFVSAVDASSVRCVRSVTLLRVRCGPALAQSVSQPPAPGEPIALSRCLCLSSGRTPRCVARGTAPIRTNSDDGTATDQTDSTAAAARETEHKQQTEGKCKAGAQRHQRPWNSARPRRRR
jgi:hypothetical protein